VRVDSIPAIPLKFVAAFGADLVFFRHAPSLTLAANLWKIKLHHYQSLFFVDTALIEN
jgi:hypothetical protein